MKTNPLLFLAACCFVAVTNLAFADNSIAVNEVLKLKNAGLGDDSIVAYIRSKNPNYELSAESIISLRDQGVSPAVLNAMMSSGTPGVSGAPQSQPAAASAPAPLPYSPAPSIAQPAVGTPPMSNPEVAYFYQELSPHGHWLLGDDHQWYWQPQVAVDTGWRPYWDQGHWVYTDNGWYWASDYPWGWAVFHYGRWHLHPHHGWIWLPDRVWGPAWVAWRSGSEYCGWAPLPPGAVYDSVGAAFTFHGRRVDATFDFGLDWNHFTFSLVREMGDPPRGHFRVEPETRNIFNRTTIVNNYTVSKTVVEMNKNSVAYGTSHPMIVNHGIDPKRVGEARGRAVESLRVEDMRTPAPNRGHEHLNPQTKTLDVYRPRFAEPAPGPGRGKEERER